MQYMQDLKRRTAIATIEESYKEKNEYILDDTELEGASGGLSPEAVADDYGVIGAPELIEPMPAKPAVSSSKSGKKGNPWW